MSRSSQVLGALVLGLLLVGCSETPDPTSTTNLGSQSASPEPSSTPSPTALSAQELTEQTFDSFAKPISLATAQGEIMGTGTDLIPATLSIESVTPGPTSSQLRFQLYADGPGEPAVNLSAFNEFTPLAADIRDVALEIEASGTRLLPLLGTRPGEPASSFSFCVCSDSPKTIDAEGITLDATFAPLAANTTSVTVLIPGFEPITDVPVTR